jgi:hypothetical protein
MFKNLNTPIGTIREALREVESRMDSCNPEELPALMAMAHELAITIQIRKDIETLTTQGWVIVRQWEHTAKVTSEDIVVFQDVPEAFLAYCNKIQDIARRETDESH